MPTDLFQQIKQLIIKNKLKEACNLLIETTVSKEAIDLMARVEKLDNLIITNQISNDEASREESRIRQALLTLVEKLETGVLYDDAYAVAIKAELATQLGRNVNISAIHSALRRLEEKGFARSEMGEPTTKRGGRRKRLFTLTQSGKIALDENRTIRNQLWQQIPDISFS